ncbi:MAG: LLM class flavin-dependent oxidoreductase [Pseudomonadales bacterium]
MKLRLGVLDQSPIRSGGTAKEALEDSVRLARLTESLGYERYWVAEHHGSNSFAGSSPELLISRIAAETSRMRVGSGGVMLPHYSPYKVAENFRLLETMYPGRIDLGIGRAPGSDMVTAQALAYGSPVGIEYFANKVIDLQALIKGEAPTTKGLESVVATPRADTVPEMWLLGSSEQSAMYAAHFGLPYSFAHFIAPDQSQACVARYQELCQQAQIPARANLGVFVICAETQAKAQQLALCRDLWRLRFEKGDPGPCPSIAEAEAFEFTEAERARLDQRNKHTIAGTPDEVRARLENLAADHGVDELVVVTICHDFADRARSYELLAEVMQLPVAA